jgi:hypothetical protein
LAFNLQASDTIQGQPAALITGPHFPNLYTIPTLYTMSPALPLTGNHARPAVEGSAVGKPKVGELVM